MDLLQPLMDQLAGGMIEIILGIVLTAGTYLLIWLRKRLGIENTRGIQECAELAVAQVEEEKRRDKKEVGYSMPPEEAEDRAVEILKNSAKAAGVSIGGHLLRRAGRKISLGQSADDIARGAIRSALHYQRGGSRILR